MTGLIQINCMVHKTDLANKLGNSEYNHQVRVVGLFSSRVAFARALRTAGLFSDRDTDATITRWLRIWGSAGSPALHTLFTYEPEVLYVQADRGGKPPWVRLDTL